MGCVRRRSFIHYVGESTGEDHTSQKVVGSNLSADQVFELHGIFIKNPTRGIFNFHVLMAIVCSCVEVRDTPGSINKKGPGSGQKDMTKDY